jgi:hypothetical protein
MAQPRPDAVARRAWLPATTLDITRLLRSPNRTELSEASLVKPSCPSGEAFVRMDQSISWGSPGFFSQFA